MTPRRWHPMVLMAFAAALPGAAVAQLTRPPTTSPTVIVGPASLSATGGPSAILLTFPAVSGATAYRVTRTNNAGDPEKIIYEGTASNPNIGNATCVAPDFCAYSDSAVLRGYLYSYRVYALFPNPSGPPIVSPPSPVASASLVWVKVR